MDGGGDARPLESGPGLVVTSSQHEERVAAAEARKLKAQGIDPIAAREAVRAQERLEAASAVTFRQCAEAFMEARKGGWKNARHAQQWKNTLETYVMPIIGNLPVQAIDVALVDKVLSPIWQAKTETASTGSGSHRIGPRLGYDARTPARREPGQVERPP